MKMKFDLSVIIVSYNTKRITVDCLSSIFESLQGNNLNIEVIVIDNNSTDGSVEEIKRLQKTHSSIVLITNKENTGFGKANNQAVNVAKSDYILLLNSDTVVLENGIEKLLRKYKENENKYQFAGGKLFNQDMTPQSSAGLFFSLPVTFMFLFLMGDRFGLTRSSPNAISRTDWISGACILTKKVYYQKLDGFDEGIFMYMEEVDLLYRASQKGWKTVIYPEAKFIHLGSASSNKTYPILQVYRGLIYFYTKHYTQFSLAILKGMLQLKAVIALSIGIITGNNYLKQTYAEAFRITKMD